MANVFRPKNPPPQMSDAQAVRALTILMEIYLQEQGLEAKSITITKKTPEQMQESLRLRAVGTSA